VAGACLNERQRRIRSDQRIAETDCAMVNRGDSMAVRRGLFLIPISESKLRPRSAAGFPPNEAFGATDDG
jgi:hypothetical protein